MKGWWFGGTSVTPAELCPPFPSIPASVLPAPLERGLPRPHTPMSSQGHHGGTSASFGLEGPAASRAGCWLRGSWGAWPQTHGVPPAVPGAQGSAGAVRQGAAWAGGLARALAATQCGWERVSRTETGSGLSGWATTSNSRPGSVLGCVAGVTGDRRPPGRVAGGDCERGRLHTGAAGWTPR